MRIKFRRIQPFPTGRRQCSSGQTHVCHPLSRIQRLVEWSATRLKDFSRWYERMSWSKNIKTVNVYCKPVLIEDSITPSKSNGSSITGNHLRSTHVSDPCRKQSIHYLCQWSLNRRTSAYLLEKMRWIEMLFSKVTYFDNLNNGMARFLLSQTVA